MRPPDAYNTFKGKKAALPRFKFTNPVTEALKAHCLGSTLAAPSFEESGGPLVSFLFPPRSALGASGRIVLRNHHKLNSGTMEDIPGLVCYHDPNPYLLLFWKNT